MTSRLRHDALVAIALASGLGIIWAWRDWANLSALRLPDTDDIMRLVQVRDWLAGQRFGDLTQYRLADGVPMHWTRLADLGPAALIGLFTPLIGRHAAEVATVTVWPLLLFALALLLVARIARRLGGTAIATTAAIVAAIAYPATTIFLPGRIDHHGLQIVMLLGATLTTIATAGFASGVVLGLLAVASFVVGLETAPFLAMLTLIVIVDWVREQHGSDRRLTGLGIALLGGLIAARAIFAPDAFDYRACDGFTAMAWRAAAMAALAPFCLATIGRRLHGHQRSVAAVIAVAVAAIAAIAVSPGCLSPYGAIDPLLASLWLSRVGEAQSLASAPMATTIAYLGLVVIGSVATAWRWYRERTRGWAILAILSVGSCAIAAIQLRGAYAGALLVAPGLAALIGGARSRGVIRLAVAWLASAGMLYPLAAQAVAPPQPGGVGDAACTDAATLARLAALPPALVVAPIDAGPLILATTHHRVLAAPYHRDGKGILALIRGYRPLPTDTIDFAGDPRHRTIRCALTPIDRSKALGARIEP